MEASSAPGQYKSAYKKYNRWNKWNNKNGENGGENDGSGQKTALLQSPGNKSSYNSYTSDNNAGNTPEASFDLGKNKRVTVRQFRNVNLIDIREYYKDSTGELRPGKKGISLTEEMFDSLLSNYRNIDDALRRLGSKRSGALESNAFSSIGESHGDNGQNSNTAASGTAGTLLVDNSGTVKNEGLNSDVAGSKRKNGDNADERSAKKAKETPNATTPAPPQQEQQKKVEELESSANLVIPTKPAAKAEDFDSDDDFANDLENELAG